MKPFQIIVLGFFGVFALIGILVFAGMSTGGSQDQVGSVVIWGTLPQDALEDVLSEVRDNDPAFEQVTYSQVSESQFTERFTEAIAIGNTPDLILIPHTLLISNENKLRVISEDMYSRRVYLDTFAEAGDIFLISGGTYGLPVLIDPLVMFYNRTTLNSAGISQPPRNWEQFLGMVEDVTVVNRDFTFEQSFVAMGTYQTVNNAIGIISSLFLQAGAPIVEQERSSLRGALTSTPSLTRQTVSALRFYTEFADPRKSSYSWTDAGISARNAFIANRLAIYFGLASEGKILERSAEALNYDVAPFPQPGTNETPEVYGEVYGFAIPNASRNRDGAFETAQELTRGPNVQYLADLIGTAPARRDLLTAQDDPFLDVYYRAALIAQGWYSPQLDITEEIFSDMVEDVVAGRETAEEAIDDAERRLDNAL